MGRISKLTQSSRVSKFRAEFEELMNRISGVSEPILLNFFLWGLKTEIRRELLITPPQSLNDAMMKAQLFEKRNDSLRGLGRFEGSRYSSMAGSSVLALPLCHLPRPHQHSVDRLVQQLHSYQLNV